MERDFAGLLASETRRAYLRLGGRLLEIRLISAYDALLCRSEGEQLFLKRSGGDTDSAALSALCDNAALATKSLYFENERAFASASAALDSLPAEALALAASEYGRLRRAFLDIGRLDSNEVRRLKKDWGTRRLSA